MIFRNHSNIWFAAQETFLIFIIVENSSYSHLYENFFLGYFDEYKLFEI